VNSTEYDMDASPFIENERTYTPVRFLAQALGVKDESLVWDPEKKTITMVSDRGAKLELTIGSSKMKVLFGSPDPLTIYMGVEPVIRDGRTYLPARFIADQFGYKVSWEADTQTVILKK